MPNDKQTTHDRCDCGGTLQFDDAEGVAHCPDCGSHERYIPKTTKSDWIAGYVDRARAFGFKIDATPNGCVYYADEGMGQPECQMVAVPCDCVGRDAGWHMAVVDGDDNAGFHG